MYALVIDITTDLLLGIDALNALRTEIRIGSDSYVVDLPPVPSLPTIASFYFQRCQDENYMRRITYQLAPASYNEEPGISIHFGGRKRKMVSTTTSVGTQTEPLNDAPTEFLQPSATTYQTVNIDSDTDEAPDIVTDATPISNTPAIQRDPLEIVSIILEQLDKIDGTSRLKAKKKSWVQRKTSANTRTTRSFQRMDDLILEKLGIEPGITSPDELLARYKTFRFQVWNSSIPEDGKKRILAMVASRLNIAGPSYP